MGEAFFANVQLGNVSGGVRELEKQRSKRNRSHLCSRNYYRVGDEEEGKRRTRRSVHRATLTKRTLENLSINDASRAFETYHGYVYLTTA